MIFDFDTQGFSKIQRLRESKMMAGVTETGEELVVQVALVTQSNEVQRFGKVEES